MSTETQYDVDVNLPPYAGPYLEPARFKSISGGRDSAKSHTAAQKMLLRMAGVLPAYEPRPVRIVSCRDFNTNLSSSVKIAVDNYAKKLFPRGSFELLKTEVRYNGMYEGDPAAGSVMTFHGVTNQEDSFLSMEDMDVFWMEQAEMLGEEMLKIEPTIRKPGSELFFIWNPAERTTYCWQRFVVNPQPGDVHCHTTYRDNLWFSKESEGTRKYIKLTESPEIYDWIYEGVPYDGDGSHKVLARATLEKCIEAWKQGLAPSEEERRPLSYAGLDLAEGGANKCALVIRSGPVIELIDEWPGVTGDLKPAAQRTHRKIFESGIPVVRVNFDGATGGMRAELQRVAQEEGIPQPYGVSPIGFGTSVNGEDVEYEYGRTNKDVFSRLNIQMGDVLRVRANRTVQLLNGEKHIDPMRCLFIRDDIMTNRELESLMDVLSQPLRRPNPTTGRWEIEKLGGKDAKDSPDRFDALCLAFVRDTHNHRAR